MGLWQWLISLFASAPPVNTEKDILPGFAQVRDIKTADAFQNSTKKELVNTSTEGPIYASVHVLGDCGVGKSQIFNAIACIINSSLQGAMARSVGTFKEVSTGSLDVQQCSLYPCRMCFSDFLGAAGWRWRRDGDVFFNDNRGFSKNVDSTLTMESIRASLEGKLAPTEVFPLDPEADEARAKIAARDPNDKNVHATYVVYCVRAKTLVNNRPESTELWKKIKEVNEACKNIKHPGGPHNTELRFLLTVTCVDELSTTDNPIRPIDLLCPIATSRCSALRNVAKQIKENLGFGEDAIAVVGFLKNLKERVFDYSDFGNDRKPDYAVMALRYYILEMIAGSASWINTNGIIQPETRN